jgi:hypothetical protein
MVTFPRCALETMMLYLKPQIHISLTCDWAGEVAEASEISFLEAH